MNVPGLIIRKLAADFEDVRGRIEAFFGSKGIVPMASIDHGQNASSAGLPLRPMLLYLFGNPKAGTILMQDRPSLGIDLPLKLLLWEEEEGVRIACNDPRWLAERHDADANSSVLKGMQDLLDELMDAAERSEW